MASANLFQAYLQPPKSVMDYGADMDKAEGNQLALAASRLQNQQAQQGVADDQSARQASIAAGGDTNKLLQLLQSSGNYKGAQALQKSMLDAQKTQSDIGLSNAHAGKFTQDTAASQQEQSIKAHDRHLQQLQGVNSPDEFMQWVRSGVGNGTLDLGKAAALSQTLQQDPSQFSTIKDKMLASGRSIQESFKQEQENARNAATNATSVTNNVLTNKTSRENNSSSNATAMRGQDLTNARARESTAATMTKPFEVTGPDGNPMLVQQDKGGNITPVQGFGPKAGASKPLNDSQAKALLFGSRMQEADKLLNDLSAKGVDRPSTAKSIADGIPIVGGALGAVANMQASPDQQSVEQAQRDFVNAVLRRESGAAIAPSEFDNAQKQYFPSLGDSKQVKAQKAANRQLAIRGLLQEVPTGQRGSITPAAAPAAPAAPASGGWSITPVK